MSAGTSSSAPKAVVPDEDRRTLPALHYPAGRCNVPDDHEGAETEVGTEQQPVRRYHRAKLEDVPGRWQHLTRSHTIPDARTPRLWNIPNVISLSRVALAVAFVVVPNSRARIVLVAVAAATDFLDGFAARLANQRSQAGALLDPIADRLFVLAAVSAYLADGELTIGQYFIFISRDLATAIGFRSPASCRG